MAIEEFPPVETADEYGIVAIGGDLEVESLLLAYRSGIFPWPLHEEFLTWFAPKERALLFFSDLHVSRSLRRQQRNTPWSICFNRDFPAVVYACAQTQNRTGQSGTWITEEMIRAYIRLHEAGYAHSIETWEGDNLLGGLYGVAIGGMFAGESMFYRQANASKLALIHLMEYLHTQGVEWLDCQVMTPLLESFGAREVPREDFMELLQEAVEKKVHLIQPKG